MDLGSVGSPLYLRIIHLQEIELVGYQEVYSLFSYPGFKLHYPGKEMKRNGGSMSDRLSCLVKTIVGSLPVQDPHPKQ